MLDELRYQRGSSHPSAINTVRPDARCFPDCKSSSHKDLRTQAIAKKACSTVSVAPRTQSRTRGLPCLHRTHAVPSMITTRERAKLRELSFSDEAIRHLTTAEAHERLGVAKPFETQPESFSR